MPGVLTDIIWGKKTLVGHTKWRDRNVTLFTWFLTSYQQVTKCLTEVSRKFLKSIQQVSFINSPLLYNMAIAGSKSHSFLQTVTCNIRVRLVFQNITTNIVIIQFIFFQFGFQVQNLFSSYHHMQVNQFVLQAHKYCLSTGTLILSVCIIKSY